MGYLTLYWVICPILFGVNWINEVCTTCDIKEFCFLGFAAFWFSPNFDNNCALCYTFFALE